MTKDAYLIGGPAAGRVLTVPDDQHVITVQFMKPEGAPGKVHREGRYEPKSENDFNAREFHWMGEY